MTLLLLAGSLASWTFDGGAPASHAVPTTVATASTPAKPASPVTSEEDAVKLALAALASVPSASIPNGPAGVAPPPVASAAPTVPPLVETPPPAAALPATLPTPPSSFPAPQDPSAAPSSLAALAASSPPPSEPLAPAPPSAIARPAPAPAEIPVASSKARQPAASAPVPEPAVAEASPDQDSFASVESLIHRLRAARHRDVSRTTPAAPALAYRPPPGERLETARTLLASGESDQARPLLEAAAAQLLLGSNDAYPSGSSAAARVDDALRWLSAGQPARALSLVDAAIATLDQSRRASALPADRRFATQAPATGPDSGLW